MNQESIKVVQDSWAKALAVAPNAGDVFYGKLFTAAPQLRSMFRGDIDQQASKLIGMLSVAVGKLGDIASLEPALRDMGKRHASYGVRPEHYDDVGDAFLDTLAVALDESFTDEVKRAWTSVYKTLSGTMIAGAEA